MLYYNNIKLWGQCKNENLRIDNDLIAGELSRCQLCWLHFFFHQNAKTDNYLGREPKIQKIHQIGLYASVQGNIIIDVCSVKLYLQSDSSEKEGSV